MEVLNIVSYDGRGLLDCMIDQYIGYNNTS